MTPSRRRAFTLVEMSVSIAVFSMVGLITYGVASEGLYAFSRNISINRSYSDARRALDRIGGYMQTAGYTPQLVDATGANTTTSPSAGIRFWRFSDTPIYNVTTPALTASSLLIDLRSPGNTSVILPPPLVGDLITIPALGFQAKAVTVTTVGNTSTVTFSGTVATVGNLTSVPTTSTITTYSGGVGTNSSGTVQYTCTDWHSVAFIAVGTQLRYYPTFIPGTTDITNAANYRVMTNLTSSVAGAAPPLPFSYGPTPTVNVDIYAEAPDYNNRNLGTANTYTYLPSAFSPRKPRPAHQPTLIPMLPATSLRSQRPTAARRGSALAATMMVVAALVTFLSIAALVTSQFGRYTGREEGDSELLAAADSSLEYLYAQWQATASASFVKGGPPTSDAFNNSSMDAALKTALNSTSLPFNGAGITITKAQIRMLNPNGTTADTGSSSVAGTSTSVPAYPGWTGTSYNYQATVTVTPTSTSLHYGFSTGSTPTITLTRSMQAVQVPLFQAAIFYENKLEIHPGAAMTVSGLVHTNGDLWARGFDQLQFKSNVSYVGGYHETGDSAVTKGWDGYGYGWIPGVTAGLTTLPLPSWSDGQQSGSSTTKSNQLSQVSPIDPFGGTDSSDNALHKIIQVPQTAADKSNPVYVYNNASLIITVNSSLPSSNSGQVVITDGSGNALSAVDTAAVRNAITVGSGNTFFDQREGTYITATSLDMTKLAAATVPKAGATSLTGLQSSFTGSGIDPNTGRAPGSGTVYIRDASTNTSTEQAIRLVNGASLGENVTIASSNPVYIQGDYNTGGTGTAVPSNQSNTDGSATPQVTGYTRYSSSVMADAVTILSGSWQDSNSAASLSSRNATPTTVNTAIMAGDIPSNYNNNQTASGGAHNFPRFLENWNNVNFTYWGSLVEAYRSTVGDGLWQTNNVYYWPNRKWNFDINFLNHQPPGVRNGLQYIRGSWIRTNS